MPVYNLHLYPWNGSTVDSSTEKNFQQTLHQQIAELHSKTFSCDPDTVRTEFTLPCGESHSRGYGGYGYEVPKGMFKSIKMSDYIVVQMDFRGSAKEWQEYCRRLVALPRFRFRNLRSVFLQRNLFEFEVSDLKVPGVVVGTQEGGEEQLPGYKEQIQ